MSEEFVMQVVLDAIEELRANDWTGSGRYEILISALSILQIYKMKNDDDEYVVNKSEALSDFSKVLQVTLIFNQKSAKEKSRGNQEKIKKIQNDEKEYDKRTGIKTSVWENI